jgi:sterol desaturase/sphingolipid hydroxylase (fatty acid hydroxylase superfamily)
MSLSRDVLRVTTYPALLVGALALFGLLLQAGAALSWAPYAAIAAVVPLVLLAEHFIPYRADWRPRRHDFVQDGQFLALTQVVVPLGLVWLATLALQGWVVEHGWDVDVWPHEWPAYAQLALKVIAGDLLRYGLHRAAHTWTPLWRLHEVHHSPDKLYATNVFRFHPLEKSLQFFCDTLPFLWLGIGADILALYFVFYAVSGLLQHANIDLRLGWLNFVFSGPEVHRWHHSRTIQESNHNYAHSFVLWDVLFGSYYRPPQRHVAALGLLDDRYPQDMWRQLAAPFRSRPTDHA